MDKAYIVANKEQELEVLKDFEEKGFPWNACENAMSFVPSERLNFNESNFPYMLMITNDNIWWSAMKTLEDETIVYDGRKEENMSKKYLVTQEFMNDLIEWQYENDLDIIIDVDPEELLELPVIVQSWHTWPNDLSERNNRLIAILQWLNGEDVFETQKTYKYYVARTSSPHLYFSFKKWYHTELPKYDSNCSEKKVFSTREEAEKWLIPGYEVVEIDGNEL